MSFSYSLLNPQQREAVRTIQGPVLILAGAGTGKTRVITMRIANMVEQGIDPGGILAVTFTNKAANEMRGRVGELVSRDQARALTIGTFHAFCVRLLRRHAEKLGYKHNFAIYSQDEQLSLVKRILWPASARPRTTASAPATPRRPSMARSSSSITTNCGRSTPWTSTTSCSREWSCWRSTRTCAGWCRRNSAT
jgi:superfamily I DNA/RNA helicase